MKKFWKFNLFLVSIIAFIGLSISPVTVRGESGTIGQLVIKTFLGLTDTPNSYSGQAGKVLKVKSDETGLEFGTGGTGSSVWGSITGTLTDQTDLTSYLSSTFQPIGSYLTSISGLNISSLTNDSGYITGINWGSIGGTLSNQTDLNSALSGKQSTLVSGTNIKTINGSSILGSGDLTVSGGGGISLTDLSASSPLTYNNLTGQFGINQSNTSTSGYLSSTDWNTFNNKLSSYTETDPVYSASSWASTTNNHSNWDTAYGWGNHASAGYLTSASSLDPSKVSQTSSYRFVTDAEKSTWNGKQDSLVSGTNIKTINSNSILGSGDLVINSMVYPGSGIPVSTGSAWGTSKTSPSGTIVGTTDSQTLTNKTLTTPIISSILNTGTLTLPTTTGTLALLSDITSALSSFVGTSSITTLGTISSGTWNGSAIADSYISSASTWNAKQSALVSGTNIKTVNGSSLLGSGDLTVSADIAGSINSATAKTTPHDNDLFGIVDTEASNVLKKLSWSNIKATFKTYYDSVATTLTNKRITPRVGSTTTSATPSINTDNYDVYNITAQATNITSMTTNLSGTPTDGQRLKLNITPSTTCTTTNTNFSLYLKTNAMSSGATTYTPTMSTAGTIPNGYLMFAFVSMYSSYPTSAPSGWTLLAQNNSPSSNYVQLYYKIANNEGANPSYTWTVASQKGIVSIAIYRGSFASSPIQTYSNVDYTTNNASIIASSITTATPNQPLLFFGSGYDTSTGIVGNPSTPTSEWNADNQQGGTQPDFWQNIASMVWTGYGATGNMTASFTTSTTAKHAFAVALYSCNRSITWGSSFVSLDRNMVTSINKETQFEFEYSSALGKWVLQRDSGNTKEILLIGNPTNNTTYYGDFNPNNYYAPVFRHNLGRKPKKITFHYFVNNYQQVGVYDVSSGVQRTQSVGTYTLNTWEYIYYLRTDSANSVYGYVTSLDDTKFTLQSNGYSASLTGWFEIE